MTHHHAAPLVHFLRRLGDKRPEHHYDAVFDEACALGADWQRSGGNVIITLHGITGVGLTDEEAVRSWITAAFIRHPDLSRSADNSQAVA